MLRTANLVEIEMHEQVSIAGQQLGSALFPLDSMISVVRHMREGTMIEVATIGREGCSVPNLLLGGERAISDTYCLLSGRAVEMRSDDVRRLLETSPNFHAACGRFLRAYLAVLGQMAACNRLHSIYQRTARWLLLARDRFGDDRIPLTHEYLALMLGSRRSGVSVAFAKLKENGLISYGPRYATIVEREGLLQAACDCYAVAREQYASVGGGLIAFGE